MKLSISFLSIKDDFENNLKKLDNSSIDYFHVDIMDNKFVPNMTKSYSELENSLKVLTKPLDVHLMVNDVMSYIDDYSKLNPDFITFHLEATDNIIETINYIKEKNIKVGLSIKPNTKVEELKEYLPYIDLVLVMSVEPGFGGQTFIPSSLNKIHELDVLRKEHDYKYKISVDGGINDTNLNVLKENGTDMVVIGSYITNSNDYDSIINSLEL